MPEAVANVAGMEANLRLQDRTAQNMKNLRHAHGALGLETIEAKAIRLTKLYQPRKQSLPTACAFRWTSAGMDTRIKFTWQMNRH